MERSGINDQADRMKTCLLCGVTFAGQQYMTIAPKKGKLESSRVGLVVKFQYILGNDVDICWDCTKLCIREAYDGSRKRRRS